MSLETGIAAAVVYNGWRTDKAIEKQTRTLLLAQESARTGKSISTLEMEQTMRESSRAAKNAALVRNATYAPGKGISTGVGVFLIAVAVVLFAIVMSQTTPEAPSRAITYPISR